MTEDKRYGYKPVHNKLGEQDHTPLNRTYTIGSASRTAAVLRERSRSQDRNTLNQTFTSFPRHFLPNSSLLRCKPQGQNLTRMLTNQLPSLEGCSPERICTQRPWTRTQIELAKYKETLKS